MNLSLLRRGDTIELRVDANAIPKGFYRFERQDGEIIICTVGKEIVFGLALEFWKNFLSVAHASAHKRTSQVDFMRRYSILLEELRGSDACPTSEAFTFCMMSPRLLRRTPRVRTNQIRGAQAA